MDTDKLLEQYFQKEQCKEDSQRLQERIAMQTYKKTAIKDLLAGSILQSYK